MMPPPEIVTVPRAGAMPATTTDTVAEVAAMEITAPAKVSAARPIPATPSWPAASSVKCRRTRRPRPVPAATRRSTTTTTATAVATAAIMAVLCQGRRCYQRRR